MLSPTHRRLLPRVARVTVVLPHVQSRCLRPDVHNSDAVPASLRARCLHTSSPLLARQSFIRRVQEKLKSVDTNKLAVVGASGYGLAKMAKFGAVAKYALPALKLTKAMPLMSMGLTTLCYSCFFGVPFAVGIVGTMFASNAARAAVLKSFGCEVPPQMMVPFFGVISGSAGGDYTKSEEYVLQHQPFKQCLAILAPAAGMFAFTTSCPLMFGAVAGSQCGWAVANTGYMMTMFSLLPMGEMTPGGQLLNYFSKNALLMGTGLNFILMIALSNPILYLCFFLNLYRLYTRGFEIFGRRIGGGDEAGDRTLRGLTVSNFTDNQKALVASMYWGLFLLNAAGMLYVSKSLMSPQQIRQQRLQEERERRAAQFSEHQQHPGHGMPVPDRAPPATSGGWGFENWALSNLQAIEDLDKDESPDWWEEQQRQAAEEVARHNQRWQ
eukprot:TRINITY_DN24465_c0_g1_i1.p1 TRINITY_DN24465_c0_g1~~TRINITY_DN24465_c0_g1_i1.p1  ORF type:complete len:439 (-),score=63.99 TRINITY_DN24465_c0_g1_i1:87-1403(-)